jgi:uncharacterized protein YhaN
MSDNRLSDELRLPSPAERQYDVPMEARVAVLEQIAKNTEKVLERLDARMDRLDARMDRLESRMERVEDRQSSDFKWLLAFGMGSTGFLFATMAHGFHWL